MEWKNNKLTSKISVESVPPEKTGQPQNKHLMNCGIGSGWGWPEPLESYVFSSSITYKHITTSVMLLWQFVKNRTNNLCHIVSLWSHTVSCCDSVWITTTTDVMLWQCVKKYHHWCHVVTVCEEVSPLMSCCDSVWRSTTTDVMLWQCVKKYHHWCHVVTVCE